MYHGEVIIGLHRHFMIKAHLLIPENHENILYSWMLNFQYVNEIYSEIYKHSKKYLKGTYSFTQIRTGLTRTIPWGLRFLIPRITALQY